MRLEELVPGAIVDGIVVNQPITVVRVEWHGPLEVTVVCRASSGHPFQQVLHRDQEDRLSLRSATRVTACAADDRVFSLVCAPEPEAEQWSRGGPLPPEAWYTYDAWNEAIDYCLFQGQHRNESVYLDMEAQVLTQIADAAGAKEEDHSLGLVRAVKDTLLLAPGHGPIFSAHYERAKEWQKNRSMVSPPFLALLAMLSLAAEQMCRGSGFRASNYYGRLCTMIGAKAGDSALHNKLVRDYAKHVPSIWRLYNSWIEDADGERGNPSAYAFDHRVHVGVPISQALMREHDRRLLPDFFLAYRLAPGHVVSRSDMRRLLQDWIPRSPFSAGLKTLMRNKEALARVADIVAVELQAWDGTSRNGSSSNSSRESARGVVVARLHRHPRPSLGLEFLVQSPGALPPGEFTLPLSPSQHAEAAFAALGGRPALLAPHLPGWQAFENDELISMPDILSGYICLERNGFRIRHDPRRLLVFERDDGLFAFIECSRARLGNDLLVLSRLELADEVALLLDGCARAGFRRHESSELPGLPAGWVAFSDVELLAIPDTRNVDLSALVPIAWTDIALGGGFRLPDRARWLRGCLPEIRVTTLAEQGELDLMLVPETDTDPLPLGSFSASTLIDLGEFDLVDGDYRVAVTEKTGEGATLASTSMRVRSSATPRVLRGDEHDCLLHSLAEDGLTALSACITKALPTAGWIEGGYIECACAGSQTVGELPPLRLGDSIGWERDPIEMPPTSMAAEGEPPDCVKTGAHCIVLPDAGPDWRPWMTPIGTCKFCGLDEYFPARPSRHRRRPREAASTSLSRTCAPAAHPPSLRPIGEETSYSMTELIEALSFAQTGPWSWFRGMAEQVDSSPWFAAEAAANLSALGHLELVLDRKTLEPLKWAMSCPTLATLANGDAVLCGWRSPELLNEFRTIADELGGRVTCEQESKRPPLIVISGIDGDDLELLAASVDSRFEVRVSQRAAETLAVHLPPLGALLDALPRFVPGLQQAMEHWDPTSNHWRLVDSMLAPGAYRTSTYPRRYGFRLNTSPARELVRGDARTVKWLAARTADFALLSYDATKQRLHCRLGAGLPGLYERAAVLCSGRPAQIEGELLVYSGVSASVASRIWEAMIN